MELQDACLQDVVSRTSWWEVDSSCDRPVPRVSPLSDSDEELDKADYVVPSSDSTKHSALDIAMDNFDEALNVDLNSARRSKLLLSTSCNGTMTLVLYLLFLCPSCLDFGTP